MYNNFLESRLSSANIQGGVKGQKLHNDILSMLKKNLEAAETALFNERDQLKLSFAKVSLPRQALTWPNYFSRRKSKSARKTN